MLQRNFPQIFSRLAAVAGPASVCFRAATSDTVEAAISIVREKFGNPTAHQVAFFLPQAMAILDWRNSCDAGYRSEPNPNTNFATKYVSI